MKIIVDVLDSSDLNLLYLHNSKLEQVHKQLDLQDYDIFGLESDFKVGNIFIPLYYSIIIECICLLHFYFYSIRHH